MARELFSFVHVTDTHFSIGNPSEIRTRAFVEMVNEERFFPRPDFVIHTGDIVRGYCDTHEEHVREMCRAKFQLDRLQVPAFYLCHNHDTFGEDVRGAVFDEVFGCPHHQEVQREGFCLMMFSGALCSSSIYGTVPPGGDPPAAGFDLYSQRGLALLRDRLAAHADDVVLVFSHAGLVTPRWESTPIDLTQPAPRRTAHGYCLAEHDAAPVRRVLEAAGNVPLHYSGHCHVNSRRTVNGIEYVSTGALRDYPGDVRLVRVFKDRLEHDTIPVVGDRELGMRWGPLRDPDHPSAHTYYAGNPDERRFVVRLKRSTTHAQ